MRRANTNTPIYLFLSATAILYFLNLGANAIWTANEGFYAEAVREMLESGDWINLSYNYEPRYNKPPFLYWLMAASASVFGLSEWALRLPGVLAGLLAGWITYRIGYRTHSHRLGIWAVFALLLSFQFVINTRNATPEIVLCATILLSLFGFLRGYQTAQIRYWLLGYLALGLAVLTKGYPFFVFVGSITGLFLLLETRGRWPELGPVIRRSGWWWGLPLAVGIGMSWTAYMYWQDGAAFAQVFHHETLDRALNTERGALKWKDLTFYIDAIAWGFLPYSLPVFIGLGYLALRRFRDVRESPALRFSIAWIAVAYVLFTIARGKIPTYFIQAHPGLALFTAYMLVRFEAATQIYRWLRAGHWFTAVVLLLGGAGLIAAFGLPPWYYAALPVPLLITWWNQRRYQSEWLGWRILPYSSMLLVFSMFMFRVLPELEAHFRQYASLGEVAQMALPQSEPLYIEERIFHNLPYYAQRRIKFYVPGDQLQQLARRQQVFAVVPKDRVEEYPGATVHWSGKLYGGSSESQFLKFMIHARRELLGEESKFESYALIEIVPDDRMVHTPENSFTSR